MPSKKLNISVCGIVHKRFGGITEVLSLLGFDVVLIADERHVSAALPPGGEEIPTPIEQDLGWAPETVRTFQGREKSGMGIKLF